MREIAVCNIRVHLYTVFVVAKIRSGGRRDVEVRLTIGGVVGLVTIARRKTR